MKEGGGNKISEVDNTNDIMVKIHILSYTSLPPGYVIEFFFLKGDILKTKS